MPLAHAVCSRQREYKIVSSLEGKTKRRRADSLPAAVREAENPQIQVVRFGDEQPLRLDSGHDLAPLTIAYQTYGTLDENKANAILVCHALSADQHVANIHPVTGNRHKERPRCDPARIFRDRLKFKIGYRLHGSVKRDRDFS